MALELFALSAELALKADEFKDGIKDAEQSVGALSSFVESAFGDIGDVATSLADMLGDVLGGAFDGLIDTFSSFMTQAIDGFAEYEQMIDGVNILFGDAAETVINNANNAWQTAQLSAHEYLNMANQYVNLILRGLRDEDEGAEDTTAKLKAQYDQQFDDAKNSYSEQYTEFKRVLDDKYDAQKQLFDDQYDALKDALDKELDALKDTLDAEYDARKKEYEAEYEARKDAYSTEYDERKKVADEEYNASKQSFETQYNARKQFYTDQYNALKQSLTKSYNEEKKNATNRYNSEKQLRNKEYQATKTALEDEYTARKKAYDDGYDDLKDVLNKEYDARKRSYSDAYDQLKDELDDEVYAAEQAADKKIDLINKEYREKLKLINEEEYQRLKAIDEEIAQLKGQSKAAEDAADAGVAKSQKARLQDRITHAKTLQDKQAAEDAYNKFVAEEEAKAVKAAAEARIDELKQKKEEIKKETDDKKDALKEQKDAAVEAAQDEKKEVIRELKETNEEKLKLFKQHNADQLTALKEAQQDRLKEYKTESEEELRELKNLNNDRLTALKTRQNEELRAIKETQDSNLSTVKEGQQQQLAALKEGQAEDLRELKTAQTNALREQKTAQNEALKEYKNAQQDELKAFKDAQQDKLKELKNAQQDQVKAAKDGNEDRLKAEKEDAQEVLKEIKRGYEDELTALKESNAAKIKELKAFYTEQKKAAKEASEGTEEFVPYTKEEYEKAATYADMAMTDMADIANRIGLPLESIQIAYSSLARGIYRTLDNLMLGYNPTKQGLNDLLRDAEAFAKTEYGINIELNADSYADIIQGIHYINEKLNITGTTSKEAMYTMQGSMNAAKAAWENFVTAVGGGGDLEKTFEMLKTSLFGNGERNEEGELGGFFNRLLPQVDVVVSNLVTIFDEALPLVVEYLPQIIEKIVPTITNTIKTITPMIVPAFKEVADAAIDAFIAVIGTDENGEQNKLGKAITHIREVIDEFLDWLSGDNNKNKGTSFTDTLGTGFELVAKAAEIALGIIEDVGKWMKDEDFSSIFDDIMKIGQTVVKYFSDNKDDIVKTITGILSSVKGVFEYLASHEDVVNNILTALTSYLQLRAQLAGVKAKIGGGILNFAGSLLNTSSQATPVGAFTKKLVDGSKKTDKASAQPISPKVYAKQLSKQAKENAGDTISFGSIKQFKGTSLYEGKTIQFGNNSSDKDWMNPELPQESLPVNYGVTSPATGDLASSTGDIFADDINGLLTLGQVFSNVVQSIKDGWDDLTKKASEKWGEIKTTLGDKFEEIRTNATEKFGEIRDKVTEKWEETKTKATEKWGEIKSKITDNWEETKTKATEKWEEIKGKVSGKWEELKTNATTKFEEIRTKVQDKWEEVKTNATTKWEEIKGKITDKWEETKTNADSKWGTIKKTLTDTWDSLSTNADTKWGAVQRTVSGVWDTLKTNAQTTWEGIKNAILNPIETARDSISDIVDKIKGFFTNMTLSFPDIKLPHFVINPQGWKIGDLLQGSIPSLSIDWYAKAYDQPTLVGVGDRYGYKGGEIVGSTAEIMGMVSESVSSKNAPVEEKLDKLISLLSDYFPEVISQMGQDIVLDGDTLVGRTASRMDKELGRVSARYRRSMI